MKATRNALIAPHTTIIWPANSVGAWIADCDPELSQSLEHAPGDLVQACRFPLLLPMTPVERASRGLRFSVFAVISTLPASVAGVGTGIWVHVSDAGTVSSQALAITNDPKSWLNCESQRDPGIGVDWTLGKVLERTGQVSEQIIARVSQWRHPRAPHAQHELAATLSRYGMCCQHETALWFEEAVEVPWGSHCTFAALTFSAGTETRRQLIQAAPRLSAVLATGAFPEVVAAVDRRHPLDDALATSIVARLTAANRMRKAIEAAPQPHLICRSGWQSIISLYRWYPLRRAVPSGSMVSRLIPHLERWRRLERTHAIAMIVALASDIQRLGWQAVPDLTINEKELYLIAQWLKVLRYVVLAKKRSDLSPSDRAVTLAWVSQLGLKRVRRATQEWCNGSYRVPSWVRSPLADLTIPSERAGVAIRLLETARDLKQEGLSMCNCVGHFAAEHALGEDVYFSLTEIANGLRATLSVDCRRGQRRWVMGEVKAADNEAVPAQSPIHQVARWLVDELKLRYPNFLPLTAIDQPWLVDRIAPGKGPIEMRVRDAAKMAERLGTQEWLTSWSGVRDS